MESESFKSLRIEWGINSRLTNGLQRGIDWICSCIALRKRCFSQSLPKSGASCSVCARITRPESRIDSSLIQSSFVRIHLHTTAHPARATVRSLKLANILAALFLAAGAAVAGDSGGDSAFILLQPVGCNATSLAQVPGSAELFLGRQPLTSDGQVAGITGPNDCSGGNPDNQSTGKIFNRWALTLSKLDWSTH